MLGIPEQEDRSDWYTFMEPLLRDEESILILKMKLKTSNGCMINMGLKQ